VEIKTLDIYKGDQNTPDFLKINPLHQVKFNKNDLESVQKHFFRFQL
jgi:hypothetical protein